MEQVTSGSDKDIAYEIIARFSANQGRSGNISKQRKKDFVDGAQWMRDKLLSATHPTGAVWVKHRDQLPESKIWRVRHHEYGIHSINALGYHHHDDQNIYFNGGLVFLRSNVEWLDESSPAPSPTAFAEWVETKAVRNGPHEWTVGTGIELKHYTTVQLYAIFREL